MVVVVVVVVVVVELCQNVRANDSLVSRKDRCLQPGELYTNKARKWGGKMTQKSEKKSFLVAVRTEHFSEDSDSLPVGPLALCRLILSGTPYEHSRLRYCQHREKTKVKKVFGGGSLRLSECRSAWMVLW